VAFSQDGRTGFARPGEYVLLSELAVYQLSSDQNTRVLMMRVPAAELQRRLVSIEDHVSRRFKPNEQMTRLLVGMIRSVAELFVHSPPPNPQALATEIISFVALTIGSEDRGAATDVRNARYLLRRRIVDFIESHLSDQSLSPKKIAASSRISLSYLYSLFNDNETTVSQFIQAKRLQRAYEILVADPRGHRTVSEIAYEVGFKNVSHFSRCFSRHFTFAPRDARQMRDISSHPNTDTLPAPPKGLLAPRVPSASRGGVASPYLQRRPLHERV
jgi:AraC-like DNA-binding protein